MEAHNTGVRYAQEMGPRFHTGFHACSVKTWVTGGGNALSSKGREEIPPCQSWQCLIAGTGDLQGSQEGNHHHMGGTMSDH